MTGGILSLDDAEGSLPLSGKISRLGQARRNGLLVPPGLVVREEILVDGKLDRLSIEELTSRLSRLEPISDRPSQFAVRSGFLAEDQKGSSMAGHFLTVLNVNLPDVPSAIEKVFASASEKSGAPLRRDVFIMPMVNAEYSGVAFTEAEYEDDLVNLTSGLAELLVSGKDSGLLVELPKLRSFEKAGDAPASAASDYLPVSLAEGLQELLRDTRRVFQDEDWDIEWAWDGARCWLLQVRPVTAPTLRNELFTIFNHKEILPELPSRFMSSLIESCSYELFDYYLQFDYTLPATRPFCEVFLGRVYINLSLFRDMMRIFGLPTSLVTNSIGGGDDRAVPINFRRLLRKIPTLVRLAAAQLTAERSARRAAHRLREQVSVRPDSFCEAVEFGRLVYKGLVKEMFSLTSAMSGPVAVLRLASVLNAHISKPTSITARMWVELARLANLAASDEKLLASLRSEQSTSHEEFERLFASFLSSYGHRGLYESDLSKPRFRETPESLKRIIANGVPETPSDRTPSILELLSLPLGLYARSKINARERFRHEAMRSFELVRKALLERLRISKFPIDEDDFWLLSIDEVRQLDTGWLPTPEYLGKLKLEREKLDSCRLPDLIRRFDDLDVFCGGESNRAGRVDFESEFTVKGNGLTGGTVTGKALVLEEPVLELPSGFEKESAVLVCRAVDAGWLATFTQVAGVCVEVGGDLSHGSILLREVGLPSVTNARGIFERVSNGDTVTIEAKRGTVHVHKCLRG